MTTQSLYRRYRPQRFADVRGQDHVVRALRHAIATHTEGHAYLFSGPRGTGKTSTARILARALNCENLDEGEPCGTCDSCVAIEEGRSYDLLELDAASNNGVDAMRDLISRASLGSPGRTKVYILDEVHMLSTAASNALLKTLEEPPEHVRFVLATTDPQKVLPTIKSRTQHYNFHLLSAEELTAYVHFIDQDAGLHLDAAAVDYVVSQGHGSARDTLSALDQVVAAGGTFQRDSSGADILVALAQNNLSDAMEAVGDAVNSGYEPRSIADSLVNVLRDAFRVALRVDLDEVAGGDREIAATVAQQLGLARTTKALETFGRAMVDMRNAPDPRVPLEVALISLCSTDDAAQVVTPGATEASNAGTAVNSAELQRLRATIATLEARIGALEAGVHTQEAAPVLSQPRTADVPVTRAPRAALGRLRGDRTAPAAGETPQPQRDRPSAPVPTLGDHKKPSEEQPATTNPPAAVTGQQLVAAFHDVVLEQLKGIAKAIYAVAKFSETPSDPLTLLFDNEMTVNRAKKYQSAVEEILTQHFGSPVTVMLQVGAGRSLPTPGGVPDQGRTTGAPVDAVASEESSEPSHEEAKLLPDAGSAPSAVERLTSAFPGAKVIDPHEE